MLSFIFQVLQSLWESYIKCSGPHSPAGREDDAGGLEVDTGEDVDGAAAIGP